MRVVELHTGTGAFGRRKSAHTSELLPLRSAAIAETAIGGYLVLRPRGSSLRRPPNLLAPLMAMGRARMSGLACMTLVGLVALFALGGPVGCRCDSGTARLAYVNDVPLEAPPVSLITTSAIDVATLSPSHPDQRSKFLPSKITTLAAAEPLRIPLVAAEPVVGTDARHRENVAMLTAVEVKTITPRRTIAADSGSGSGARVAGYVATAEETAPMHRPHARERARHRTAANASPRGRRAPGWARQMYDNNWQGTAFSYVR